MKLDEVVRRGLKHIAGEMKAEIERDLGGDAFVLVTVYNRKLPSGHVAVQPHSRPAGQVIDNEEEKFFMHMADVSARRVIEKFFPNSNIAHSYNDRFGMSEPTHEYTFSGKTE